MIGKASFSSSYKAMEIKSIRNKTKIAWWFFLVLLKLSITQVKQSFAVSFEQEKL